MREHNEAVNRLDFMSSREPIEVEYAPGTVEVVEQHDGSVLALRKLAADYDPTDRSAALGFLQDHAAKGEIVTGLLYVEPDPEDLHAHLNTVDGAAQHAGRDRTVPGPGGAGKAQRVVAVGDEQTPLGPLRPPRGPADAGRQRVRLERRRADLVRAARRLAWVRGFNAIDTAGTSRWV